MKPRSASWARKRVEIKRFVGAELRRLRLAAGLTQSEVGRATGVDRAIVARVERGIHGASLRTIDRQARACNGSLARVLFAYDVATGWLKVMP